MEDFKRWAFLSLQLLCLSAGHTREMGGVNHGFGKANQIQREEKMQGNAFLLRLKR